MRSKTVCPIRVLEDLIVKSLMAPSTATHCLRSVVAPTKELIYWVVSVLIFKASL